MIQRLVYNLKKGIGILHYRLKEQGLYTTLQWAYARGIPRINGIPIYKYSQITRDVYVGAQIGLRGKNVLKKWGINATLNLRIEFDDAQHGLTLEQYCYIPVVDDNAPTLGDLKKGVIFIRQIINDGGKVYIHCAGGVGRAPTMAAAYFIAQGMTLDESLILIRQGRPFIHIMPVQMESLEEWQRRYHAVNS